MLKFEVCHPENPSDIESVWPVLQETLLRHLGDVDPAAAYAASFARETGEPHDAALADAWDAANLKAQEAAFAGWHRHPETLTVSAI